ncbi:MAG: DUF4430 domain-containing protein [Oscillospiraceae bacterium]|jgi:hypothetical protein|nr:DUF4430 domain-containing protein [Oscillospiraceae bacterium]
MFKQHKKSIIIALGVLVALGVAFFAAPGAAPQLALPPAVSGSTGTAASGFSAVSPDTERFYAADATTGATEVAEATTGTLSTMPGGPTEQLATGSSTAVALKSALAGTSSGAIHPGNAITATSATQPTTALQTTKTTTKYSYTQNTVATTQPRQTTAGNTATTAPAATTAARTTTARATEAPATTQKKTTVTLSIRCDTVLHNMDKLKAEKRSIVPSDGAIFSARSVNFTPGESVFDVLKRETQAARIQMEFTNVPLYNSSYIEGIGNLYEFDCGPLSGWMYKVNGVFPSSGSSNYALQEGDVIEWVYSCDLGRDVGGAGSAGQGRS